MMRPHSQTNVGSQGASCPRMVLTDGEIGASVESRQAVERELAQFLVEDTDAVHPGRHCRGSFVRAYSYGRVGTLDFGCLDYDWLHGPAGRPHQLTALETSPIPRTS